MKEHAWKRWSKSETKSYDRWETWCGLILPSDIREENAPTAHEHEGATCERCVVRIRDEHLWEAGCRLKIATEATELLEVLRRKSARRRARRRLQREGARNGRSD